MVARRDRFHRVYDVTSRVLERAGVALKQMVIPTHEEARKRIQTAANRAATRVREYTPWSVEGPVEMKFEFKDKAKSPDRVYRGKTVLEAYEAWLGK